MINNNKGAILLVTIVSMMILTIIGYITLQMTSSQGVSDTYDQARIRVGYAAEGIVERARGYIDYVYNNSFIPLEAPTENGLSGDIGTDSQHSGVLFSIVNSSPEHRWNLFDGVVDPINHHYGFNGSFDLNHIAFDDSIYPRIEIEAVWCEFTAVGERIRGLTANKNGYSTRTNTDGGDGVQTYKIVGVAKATINASGIGVIRSTVTYYFNAEHTSTDNHHITRNRFLAWRKEL